MPVPLVGGRVPMPTSNHPGGFDYWYASGQQIPMMLHVTTHVKANSNRISPDSPRKLPTASKLVIPFSQLTDPLPIEEGMQNNPNTRVTAFLMALRRSRYQPEQQREGLSEQHSLEPPSPACVDIDSN